MDRKEFERRERTSLPHACRQFQHERLACGLGEQGAGEDFSLLPVSRLGKLIGSNGARPKRFGRLDEDMVDRRPQLLTLAKFLGPSLPGLSGLSIARRGAAGFAEMLGLESDTPREAGGLMSWAASKAVGASF